MQANKTFCILLNIKSRMNVNNMIYALKVSLLCVGGMLVTELLNLPKAYLFPLSVVIVTQPYTKLTRRTTVTNIEYVVYGNYLSVSILLYRYHMAKYFNTCSDHYCW